jgi:hypothetical protein
LGATFKTKKALLGTGRPLTIACHMKSMLFSRCKRNEGTEQGFNYFLTESTTAFTVESTLAAAESIATTAESATADTVESTAATVESTAASVVSAALLQATAKEPIARTKRSFFMRIFFFLMNDFLFIRGKEKGNLRVQNFFSTFFWVTYLYFAY